MKAGLLGVCIAAALVLIGGQAVGAESLRIQPLQYQTELKKGERKKGHIDITNPSSEPVKAKFYVEAFRQVDDKGNLTFFKSEQLEKGLLLDYDSITIEARQTLRLFFIADGTKLPTGDVFGVIFAETQPLTPTGANTTVRVGSLVMITNQTPGSRNTEISKLSVPFFQIGSVLRGTLAVKNPAPKNSATGFFPMIQVSVAPWGESMKRQGPLIFAGNTRIVDFDLPSNAFGLYEVSVQANNARKTVSVFLITGWWQIVTPALLVATAGAFLWWQKRYRRTSKKPRNT